MRRWEDVASRASGEGGAPACRARCERRERGEGTTSPLGCAGAMGYRDPPPWVFEGKALYQLNLVRTEDARAHVPKDLRLVECFGYTLGGLYVARYDESPCGKLDEVVVLGGLVWNPPTSCAWASRVYVDSAEARAHGIRTCGLPSRVATFKEERGAEKSGSEEKRRRKKKNSWWFGGKGDDRGDAVSIVDSKERVCRLAFPATPKLKGPRISMFLPSFSGRTKLIPDLLKYSLQMRANIRLSAPIKVETSLDSKRGSIANVLKGKPLVCIAFDNMRMDVGAPQKVKMIDSK